MDVADLQALTAAAAARAPAVLTLHWRGVFYSGRSRMLSADPTGLWVETPEALRPLLPTIQGEALILHVAFRGAGGSSSFAAPLLLHNPILTVEDKLADALLLMLPAAVDVPQQRQSYRVTVFDQTRLSPKVWRIQPGAVLRDKPAPSSELWARMHDLSQDGTCLILHPRVQQQQPFDRDQRFRIALTYQDEELLFDARARYMLHLPDGSMRVGAQFRRIDTDLRARQSLARLPQIIGDLQREEARLFRDVTPAAA
jgi:hypothetical protein